MRDAPGRPLCRLAPVASPGATRARGPASRLATLFPLKRALLPLVEESDDQHGQEDHHRGEAEEADLRQDDSPREEECDFQVEQDEENRDQVIADVEFHPRILERLE